MEHWLQHATCTLIPETGQWIVTKMLKQNRKYCNASQQAHNGCKKAAAPATTPSTTPDHTLLIWWLKP